MEAWNQNWKGLVLPLHLQMTEHSWRDEANLPKVPEQIITQPPSFRWCSTAPSLPVAPPAPYLCSIRSTLAKQWFTASSSTTASGSGQSEGEGLISSRVGCAIYLEKVFQIGEVVRAVV